MNVVKSAKVITVSILLVIFALSVLAAVYVYSSTDAMKADEDIIREHGFPNKRIVHSFEHDNRKIIFYEQLRTDQIGVVCLEKSWFSQKVKGSGGFLVRNSTNQVNWAFTQLNLDKENGLPILYGVIDSHHTQLEVEYISNGKVTVDKAIITQDSGDESFWYLILDTAFEDKPPIFHF
ncbi:hypothetical protein [Marinicrinis sediminis]|uniref:Uncharacterized protein n=1 Tax=Marinicrinis sediminis TaxID=1652465 RepID=A0ABW5RFT2_9BACL